MVFNFNDTKLGGHEKVGGNVAKNFMLLIAIAVILSFIAVVINIFYYLTMDKLLFESPVDNFVINSARNIRKTLAGDLYEEEEVEKVLTEAQQAVEDEKYFNSAFGTGTDEDFSNKNKYLKKPLKPNLKNLDVVYLKMDSCPYCKKMDEYLKKNNYNKDVKLVDINTEIGRKIANKFNISGFPAFVSLRTNKSVTGYVNDINKIISSLA